MSAQRPQAEAHAADPLRAEACPTGSILGMVVHATSYSHASDLALDWARGHASRYICVATVNNVMEAYDSAAFRRVMNEADLVTPDGMPLVWGLKLLGCRNASRVYGQDLTPIVLQMAMENGIPVGFYGGSPACFENPDVRNRLGRFHTPDRVRLLAAIPPAHLAKRTKKSLPP